MKISLFSLLFLSICILGCDATRDTATTASSDSEAKHSMEPTEGIVNWTSLVVRETPADEGKYLTSIYQGEELKLLGQVQKDSTSERDNVYAKVELSDGKTGWVLERFIAADAKAAAIVTETDVYKRPDLLTRSDKKFYRMDFVAVKEADGDWINVVGVPKGSTWYAEGWIKKDKISESDIDVSFAVLANRASNQDDEAKRKEELDVLLSNSDLQGSVFYADLKQQNEGEVVEPTEELKAESGEMAVDSVATDEI